MILARARYVYASGLGNRLWPWARCIIYSRLHHVPMIKPLWVWPMRVGPLVKQRMPVATWPGHLYMNLFRTTPAELAGARRAVALFGAREIPEPASLDSPPPANSRGIVTFTGDGGMFEPLRGHEAMLKEAIRAMTRERWLRAADGPPEVPIGIHVRRSDFKVATHASQFVTDGGLRTPLGWFVNSLRLVRRELGANVRAYVVSDGRPEDLSELLAEPSVELMTDSSPISDMLLLSRASILVGSGGSSFSAWASFLGGMPSITHPGQSLRWFKLQPRDGQFVDALDPSAPAPAFLAEVARLGPRLRAAKG